MYKKDIRYITGSSDRMTVHATILTPEEFIEQVRKGKGLYFAENYLAQQVEAGDPFVYSDEQPEDIARQFDPKETFPCAEILEFLSDNSTSIWEDADNDPNLHWDNKKGVAGSLCLNSFKQGIALFRSLRDVDY